MSKSQHIVSAYRLTQERRALDRMAERQEIETMLRALPPRDPCAACDVRPEHHDQFGCRSYTLHRR